MLVALRNTLSWFSSSRVRVSLCLNYSTIALGYQLNPPEAEQRLCSDMINTSPTVSSAVAI